MNGFQECMDDWVPWARLLEEDMSVSHIGTGGGAAVAASALTPAITPLLLLVSSTADDAVCCVLCAVCCVLCAVCVVCRRSTSKPSSGRCL
jgi:hypothetical protein